MVITKQDLKQDGFSRKDIARYQQLIGFKEHNPKHLIKFFCGQHEIDFIDFVFRNMPVQNYKDTIHYDINNNDLFVHEGSLAVNGRLKARKIMVKKDLIVRTEEQFTDCLIANQLEVGGDLFCNYGINVKHNIDVAGDIICGGPIFAGSIDSGGEIKSDFSIGASQSIRAQHNIKAYQSITASGGSIVAGGSIRSNGTISAGYKIKCKTIDSGEYGIYVGAHYSLSDRSQAVVIAKSPSDKLVSGYFKNINEKETYEERIMLGRSRYDNTKCC